MFDEDEMIEDIMTPDERKESDRLWNEVAGMNDKVNSAFEAVDEYLNKVQTALQFDLEHEGETPRNLDTNTSLEDAFDYVNKLKFSLGRG